MPGKGGRREPESRKGFIKITFPTPAHGKAVMAVLSSHILEGRTIAASKVPTKTPHSFSSSDLGMPVPEAAHIRRCVSDAFHERAFRDEVEKRGLASALAKQEERLDIFHPSDPPANKGRVTRGGMTVVEKAVKKLERNERRREKRKQRKGRGSSDSHQS